MAKPRRVICRSRPPQGWDRAAEWESERRSVAAEVVRPALERWVATISELLPRARPSAQAGLVHLPGGAANAALMLETFWSIWCCC